VRIYIQETRQVYIRIAQGSGPCSCIRVAITTRQVSAVTLDDLSSLITEDLAILSLFNFKHLFTSKRLIRRLKGGKVNKFLRLVLN